ncbi:MAG: NIPSNAP family protein, partial [Dehalococcoidia bacterium]
MQSNATLRGVTAMLYELRTYTLKPNSVPEVEKRFGEALPTRTQYSRLVGFWHTEIGPLNQILHLWAYDSLQQRSEVRQAAAKDPSGNWPPKITEFLETMENDILVPGPVNDPLDGPREWGNLYELRMYTYPVGAVRHVMEQFCAQVGGRAKMYPLGGLFMSELGQMNRLYQLWPYKDWDHRDQLRAEYSKTK